MVPLHSWAAAAPAATSPSTANRANTRTNRWAIAFSLVGVGTGGESLVPRVRAVKGAMCLTRSVTGGEPDASERVVPNNPLRTGGTRDPQDPRGATGV